MHFMGQINETIYSFVSSAMSRVRLHGLLPEYEGTLRGHGPGAVAGSGRKDGCPSWGTGACGHYLSWR